VLPHPETLQNLNKITGHAKCAECIDRKAAFNQARNIKTHTK
jgi:hypothetical protein